jgi:hypothetical protein
VPEEKGIEDENEILLFRGVHITDDIVALFFSVSVSQKQQLRWAELQQPHSRAVH